MMKKSKKSGSARARWGGGRAVPADRIYVGPMAHKLVGANGELALRLATSCGLATDEWIYRGWSFFVGVHTVWGYPAVYVWLRDESGRDMSSLYPFSHKPGEFGLHNKIMRWIDGHVNSRDAYFEGVLS